MNETRKDYSDEVVGGKTELRLIKRKSYSKFSQCTLDVFEPCYWLECFWLCHNGIPKTNGLHRGSQYCC